MRIGELDLDADTLLKGGQVYGEKYPDGRQRKTAVISSTGIGDGRYPVYAKIVTDPQFGRRVAEQL
jgi:hypothetical protein